MDGCANSPPTPSYLMLHRTNCWTVNKLIGTAAIWTRGQYRKIGGTRSELESWAAHEVGGTVIPCRICLRWPCHAASSAFRRRSCPG